VLLERIENKAISKA